MKFSKTAESENRRSEALKEYFRNRPKVSLVKREFVEHIVIQKIYPKPITPDPMPEDLELCVGDFKPRKTN